VKDNAEDIIRLENVEKVYPGAVETQVLFDINLGIGKGTFNSIVGQSGSGKTTLLNIIGTLDRPTRGSVTIDGQRTDSMTKDGLAELRNRVIGFIFQFHFLLPEFTALENVLMPYRIGNAAVPESVMKRADELFELAGITRIKNNPATRMSGGQQQRTAVIRALINQPKVVLADEPSGNLDSDNTDSLYDMFRNINRELGTTFIIVTHDRHIADRTDRVIEMRDGRIVLDIDR